MLHLENRASTICAPHTLGTAPETENFKKAVPKTGSVFGPKNWSPMRELLGGFKAEVKRGPQKWSRFLVPKWALFLGPKTNSGFRFLVRLLDEKYNALSDGPIP
jgi:hypothetical protein